MPPRASCVDRNLFFLVHLKKLLTGGFGRKHYGQWAEDAILEKLLPEKQGFFVDVGAYHPMHYSNTYLLYKRGWRGINIDPNPASILLFNVHRRGDTNLNYGVSERAGEAAYYRFNHQSCNTFSREQKDALLRTKFIRFLGETRIATLPLQSILDEHAADKDIDLLNVDVEGMGLEVLRTLDWDRSAPRIICVEDEDLDLSKQAPYGSAIYTYLTERGYSLKSTVGLSSVYARTKRT